MRLRMAVVLFTCVGIVGGAFGVVNSDGLSWRARVIGAKVAGELPEIPVPEFVRWLVPGSSVWLQPLAEYPNVHAAIQNPVVDTGSIANGSQIYAKFCAHCHGNGGRGETGPDLISSVSSTSDWAFLSAAKWGRARTAMAPQPISDLEIWQVHAYLRGVAFRSLAGDDDQPPAKQPELNVAAKSLLRSADRPHEWLTYAGNYAGHRRSELSQISKKNIRDLRVAWIAQLRSADNSLESSPIVAGGMLFVTESPDGVVAFDARTGQRAWRFRRPVPANLQLCCGAVNRGAAILGDTVFVATLDAYLVALDAATGRKKWETKVAEYRDGYAITGAPLAHS